MITSEEVKDYYNTIYHGNHLEDKVNWGKMFPYYHTKKGSSGYYNIFFGYP